MSKANKAHALFKPVRSKADITDHQAKAIIQAEAVQREAKTARLRLARLRQMDDQSQEKSATKPSKTGKPKLKRAVSSM